jgi:hypothetical protein
MSNTTNQIKIQRAGIKVGGKVTSLVSLKSKVLNADSSKLDKKDATIQVDVHYALSVLSIHLPFIVSDAEKFSTSPTKGNLSDLCVSLKLLANRINQHLGSE